MNTPQRIPESKKEQESAEPATLSTPKDSGNPVVDSCISSAHAPRLTAEDVQLADREAKDADRYWQDFADSLNTHLSHPETKGEEWEELHGENATAAGWTPTGSYRKSVVSDTWFPMASRDSFVAGFLYRRPRQATKESQTTNKEGLLKAADEARERVSSYSLDKRTELEASARTAIGSADSQPRGGKEMATPETEAASDRIVGHGYKGTEKAILEFARQLERQRDEARAQLVEANKITEGAIASEARAMNDANDLTEQLTTVKAEVERLKEREKYWDTLHECDQEELTQLRQAKGGRLLTETDIVTCPHLQDLSDKQARNVRDYLNKWTRVDATSPWTAIAGPETLPKKEDGDKNHEVLFERDNGVRIVDNYTANNPHYKFWMPIPPLPTPKPEQVEDWELAYEKEQGTQSYPVRKRDFQAGWLAAQEKGKV